MELIAKYLFILFMVLNSAICHEDYNIKITKVQCVNADPEIIKNHTCYVKPYNRTVQLMTVILVPTYNLTVLKIRTLVNYKVKVYQPFLIDITEDFCGFAGGKEDAPFINMVWSDLGKFGNVNHACPYMANEEVILKNFVLYKGVLPQSIPSGEYRFDIIFISKRPGYKKLRNIVTVEIYITAVLKNIFG